MILSCEGHSVEVGDQNLQLNTRCLGCSIVGNGDLYDIGFREEKLREHGLMIYDGDHQMWIKEIPKRVES